CGSLFRLRLDDELDAPVGRQKLQGSSGNVRRRQRRISREILSEVVRVTSREIEIRVQLIGLAAEAADTLHLAVEPRLDLVLRALQLPCVGARRAARDA